MMNTASPFALAVTFTLGLLATGCGAGLVPFTHELREQNRLTDDEIRNLQFYVSHKITLRRELESGGRQVTGSHKLLLTSGKSIEEVVVEEKTPGIALAVKGPVITLSFEPGTSMDFVVEGARGAAAPEPVRAAPQGGPDPFPGNNGRPPELMPERALPASLSGNYFLWVEPSGQINFQSKMFDAVEDSNQAHLLIDADTLKQVVQNHKVLPGIRLPSK
jgi:hypothetical protein